VEVEVKLHFPALINARMERRGDAVPIQRSEAYRNVRLKRLRVESGPASIVSPRKHPCAGLPPFAPLSTLTLTISHLALETPHDQHILFWSTIRDCLRVSLVDGSLRLQALLAVIPEPHLLLVLQTFL
jgi:hypothetical protein